MPRHNYRSRGRPCMLSPTGSDSHNSWPYSEQDSLCDEVLAHPQLDTTLSASLDTVTDDLLYARLTTQRSTPVPYEPPYYPPAEHQPTHAPYFSNPLYYQQLSARYHDGQTHGGSYNRALHSSSLAGPQRLPDLDVPGDGNWSTRYLPPAGWQVSPYSPTSSDLRPLHSPSLNLSQYQFPASSPNLVGHSPSRGAVPSVAEANALYPQSLEMSHASFDRTISGSRGTPLPYTRVAAARSPVPYNMPSETPEPTVKKKAKRLDAHQIEALSRVYACTPYPTTEERRQLASDLDMSARSVQIWFQNQRQNQRQRSRGGQNPANPPQVAAAPPPSTSPVVVYPRESSAPVTRSPMGEPPNPPRSLLLAMMRSGEIPSPSPPSGRPRARRHWPGRSRGH